MYYCVHVCSNGHYLVTRNPISDKEFCEKCGSEMMDKCPHCHNPIKEWKIEGLIFLDEDDYQRASYCKHCGQPYPWTQAALETITELIQEESELDNLQQDKLITSLPDIISETPKTQLAVVRLKKALLSAGKFTADALRQFAIDFGCEFAKKQLGL